MYQHIANEMEQEQNFNKLMDAFDKSIMRLDTIESITTEFDLSKFYRPNHSCIWNKIFNMNKLCIIIEKNDKLALVQFIDGTPEDSTLPRLYRLEDLSITDQTWGMPE